MNNSVLIFDFDGTLCDSLDESIIIANNFLKLIGKPSLTSKLVRSRGLKQVLKDYKVPTTLLPIFMLYYRWQVKKHIKNMPLFPGLQKVIPKLATKHTLGIVTSNSVSNVNTFLSKYKLGKYFSFIDSELSWVSKDKKVIKVIKDNNLSHNKTYYIGDESRDIIAMKRIDIPMIAVTWGIEEAKLLRSLKPFKLISKPEELLLLGKQQQR